VARVMEGQLQRIVGRNLRRHHLEQGQQSGAFAERMGVHQAYFNSEERGERTLTSIPWKRSPSSSAWALGPCSTNNVLAI
jgi:hypothetical protein